MSNKLNNFLGSLTRRDITRAAKITIIGGFIAIIGSYSIMKTHDLIFGITLDIKSPDNGATVTDIHTRIVGQAPNSSTIFINDGKILADQEGNFLEEFILAPGLNVFEIRAQDRFGREETKLISLVYKESEITNNNDINQ